MGDNDSEVTLHMLGKDGRDIQHQYQDRERDGNEHKYTTYYPPPDILPIKEEDGEGREGDTTTSTTSPPVLLEVLESDIEKKARRISHLVAYFTTFIMSIGFSIVLTGVWPYLQQLEPGVSKQSLGWVIAANPLGQMIASPLLGLWGNKVGSSRGAFLLTVFTFTLGNVLYAVLHCFGTAAKSLMIFSRFMVGVSSANIALIRSYIAASTRLKERTTAVSLTSASQGLGFIFGPAIQAALAVAFTKPNNNTTLQENNTLIMERLEGLEGPMEGLEGPMEGLEGPMEGLEGPMERLEGENVTSGLVWNMYTATGWIGVVLGIINFILFMPCIFKERRIAAKEAELQMRKTHDNNTNRLPEPDRMALVTVLSSFFIFLMVYVLLETLLVPMCIDLYAWSDEMAVTVVGIGLSIAGAGSVLTFIMAGCLSRRMDERKVYVFMGILPMMLAMLIHLPMGSTYPKIKNCTIVTTTPIPFNITTTTMPTIHILPLNLTTITAAPTIHTLPNNKADEDTIDPIANTLTRRRRHTTMGNNTCTDVGCPAEQEWCFNTPIIEKSQLVVANMVALLGYPIAFTLASALFSKILGPKPQGVWMGILTSTGSLSRITGPILVTYMYTSLGPRWTFLILFFILLLTFILNLVMFKRLKPMKVTSGGGM
ncbi:hypothetical protein Pmani_021658 [Petrolisthes manimaculis]|uniref:Major facilitator superfamily (MFS) profile domain-containing protein n=1 Tax=Petrolisthes manimaculis TaxID=1843537 RepID=A0AAE1U1F8_9EUCA|nr:hypothetical protein Pmani_021658 [Petrolisthes manimaculis]